MDLDDDEDSGCVIVNFARAPRNAGTCGWGDEDVSEAVAGSRVKPGRVAKKAAVKPGPFAKKADGRVDDGSGAVLLESDVEKIAKKADARVDDGSGAVLLESDVEKADSPMSAAPEGRVARGFNNTRNFPLLVGVVYDWLATKPGVSLPPFQGWLSARVGLFLRECVSPGYEAGPYENFFVRTGVQSVVANNLRAFMGRMYAASPAYFDSLRLESPKVVHPLSVVGFMLGASVRGKPLVMTVVENSLSVCHAVNFARLGAAPSSSGLSLPPGVVADYTWLWNSHIPPELTPRGASAPVVWGKEGRFDSGHKRVRRSAPKDDSFVPDEEGSTGDSGSEAACGPKGGKAGAKRVHPIDHTLFLALPGGPEALGQIENLDKLRQQDACNLFVRLFKHLAPAFRADVMDELGLQEKPDEDLDEETCNKELADLMSPDVDSNTKLRIRLETMTIARVKAKLVGFPFHVNERGTTEFPKDLQAMISLCRLGPHVAKLVDALSDSFLVRHCLRAIVRFFPHDDKKRKVLASERIFRALCSMEGLWNLYIQGGEAVVASGSFFDVVSRSFRSFDQTTGFLESSALLQGFYRDTFASLTSDGYPVSAARRLAYNAFVKHPDFVSEKSGFLSSSRGGILKWVGGLPDGDPVRALFLEAYPPAQCVLISRSTQHVQGAGLDDGHASPGAEYDTDDDPSDSNKLWAQNLRAAQAANRERQSRRGVKK